MRDRNTHTERTRHTRAHEGLFTRVACVRTSRSRGVKRANRRTCADQSKRATTSSDAAGADRIDAHADARAMATRGEDDATRRARRLEANRAASAASRARKRALERDARRRVDALERLTRALATENAVLKDALSELTRERRAGWDGRVASSRASDGAWTPARTPSSSGADYTRSRSRTTRSELARVARAIEDAKRRRRDSSRRRVGEGPFGATRGDEPRAGEKSAMNMPTANDDDGRTRRARTRTTSRARSGAWTATSPAARNQNRGFIQKVKMTSMGLTSTISRGSSTRALTPSPTRTRRRTFKRSSSASRRSYRLPNPALIKTFFSS